MVLGSDREQVRRMGAVKCGSTVQEGAYPTKEAGPRATLLQRPCSSKGSIIRDSERRKKKKKQRHRSFFSRPVIEKPHQEADGSAHVCLRRSGRPLPLEGPCRTLARGADNVEQRRHDTSTREGRARSSQEDGKSDREGRDSVGSGCDGDEEDGRAAGRFRKAGGCAGSSQAKERRRRQVKLEGAGQGVAVVPVRVAGLRRRPHARKASPQQRRRLHGARALCRG
jgi:hypothetical protein